MSAEPVPAARTLILLRHGRTAWNHAHRVQGQLDVELDDTGHTQAAQVAPVLAAPAPSVLWCSDLARARQTASYLCEATGLDPAYDERLREFALGQRQGLTHEEYAGLAPEEFAVFRRGDFDVVPDGERTAAVGERMVAVLRELLAQVGPGETALAVSHGAAIRVAVTVLLGWPAPALHSFTALANCGWAVLHVPSSGPVRLAAYNRVVPA